MWEGQEQGGAEQRSPGPLPGRQPAWHGLHGMQFVCWSSWNLTVAHRHGIWDSQYLCVGEAERLFDLRFREIQRDPKSLGQVQDTLLLQSVLRQTADAMARATRSGNGAAPGDLPCSPLCM